MRMLRLTGLMTALLLVATAAAGAADIRGTYVEARNAEIYASHCYANSETGLRGELAVMGWRVDEGAWNGVALDGLGVVAVVRAASTLGDPFGNPYPAQSVLIVDEKANAEQRAALESFARYSGGRVLANVARVDAAPVSLNFEGSIHGRKAKLTAGDAIEVRTRAIHKSDSLCHLDDVFYRPLAELTHAMPAFALENRFEGEGLGVQFSAPNRSSAYVGEFAAGRTSASD